VGVLLYPPIKEKLLLDRTLVIIGLTFTSVLTMLLGLAPKEPTPEVAKITFIDVTPFLLEPPSTTSTTSTLPEVIPAGIPTDQTQRCPQWEAKFAEHGLPVRAFSYIAYRESKCNPKAVNARWNSKGQLTYTLNNNGTWDSGLVQINSSWVSTVREVCNVDTGSFRRDLEALLKADCNLKVAKWIMENSSGKLRNWSIYGG
jgi:hypothetical protein